ncbi:MAG: S1 RNA-binding domain-containing protein [Ilumatobacteraceae bacterium]
MAKHVVVDGSNLATEGRTVPSLKQLNEAVLAFMTENPDTKITVVVDASFGHRIDKKEVTEFNSAIDNNELVSPPAGAVGRGDGFVLTIAEKVGASVLSNDSYQEFHQQYKWLFEPGRLIGGKPVPNVGWVFIERLPVRVSANRESANGRKNSAIKTKRASREAQRPMPIPKTPPPSARTAPKPKVSAPTVKVATTKAPVSKQVSTRHNELAPFLNFVERHPVGSKVKGVVDAYSAHGVYVRIGDIRGYLPLQLMANPAPRSARDHVKLNQQVSLVVASFTPSRRSVEVGVVGVELPATQASKSSKKRGSAPPSRKASGRKK